VVVHPITHPCIKKTEQNPTPTKKPEKESNISSETGTPTEIPSLTGKKHLERDNAHGKSPRSKPTPSSLPHAAAASRSAAGVTASAAHPNPRTPSSPACPGAASSASLISAVSHAFRCRLATTGQTGQFVATAGQLCARQLPIVEVMVLPPQPSASSLKPPPHSPSCLLSVLNRAGPATVVGTAAVGIPPSKTCPTSPAVATPPRRPSCLSHQQDMRGLPPSGHRHAAESSHAAAPSILLTTLIQKALVCFIHQHLICALTPCTAAA
jgi:hypothetical protein